MSRILLVEDDRDLGPLMELVLRQRGHAVDLVIDGREASALAQGHPFDLIITALTIPGNGAHLTRQVRACAVNSRVPILLVTAPLSPDGVAAAMEAGIDDYLPKPVAVARLMRSVERLTTCFDRSVSAGSGQRDVGPVGPSSALASRQDARCPDAGLTTHHVVRVARGSGQPPTPTP